MIRGPDEARKRIASFLGRAKRPIHQRAARAGSPAFPWRELLRRYPSLNAVSEITETLLRKYRDDGDVGAMERLHDLTAGSLFRLAVRRSHTIDEAEDLVQTTYLRAMESDRFEGRGTVLQ